MNVMYPELISFVYNFLADYIVLFFVRKDLFPEIKLKRLLSIAFVFSFTYILWNSLTENSPSGFRVFLKWMIIYSLLCILFKIHSVKLFIKTVVVFLLYIFLLAGSLSFFLSFINEQEVNEEGAAYKAMAIMIFCAVSLALWKQKKKRESQKKTSEANLYEIQIARKGRKIEGQAIYDSGNFLNSQITGQGVCILQESQAKQLLLPEEWEIINRFYKTEQTDIFNWKERAKQIQSGIYILQYSTVGNKKARMPGIMAEEIVVLKNKEVLVKTKGMLGISQEELSEENRFSVLLPADIFDREKNRSII